MEQQPRPPHVLFCPAPAQGHINSMLKLAELISLAALRVTFLISDHSHHRLLHNSDVLTRFARFPNFRFQTITDGLPAGHPRTFDRFWDIINSFKSVTKPLLRQMLISGHFGTDLTCIVLDGFFSFLIDLDDSIGIPIFYFRTISACSFWAYLSVRNLIDDGQLPIKGKEDMDRVIENVAGMENLLRCRDLPGFCRIGDPNDPILQFFVDQTFRCTEFHALIFNTFEDLEAPILSRIRTLCPNIYAIGPLHAHLKTRLSSESESLNSLWEADRSCLEWLDDQPPKSVLYVSFGSITVMENEQLMEFWHGLVNSGRKFLWAMRPNMVTGRDVRKVPAEVEEGTRKRGYIVRWAPQEEVLAHEAIGGFLTHGGWNSTLESMVAGVPMICWSYIADQQVNSRFVSNVWKVGVDMKDICDRETVARMVNDLMENRREEFMRSSTEIASLARRSVTPGGSSYVDFDRLVKDIKLLSQNKREMGVEILNSPLC